MVPDTVGVIFFWAAVLCATRGRALWSEELRWAQIPREMLQSKEYFLLPSMVIPITTSPLVPTGSCYFPLGAQVRWMNWHAGCLVQYLA